MTDKFSQIFSCHEIEECLDELRDVISEGDSTELLEAYLATTELLLWVIEAEFRAIHVLWSFESLTPGL